MFVYRSAGQVINPVLAFHQTHVFAEELVTVTESGSAADNQELGLGTGESDIDTTPVAKELADIVFSVTADAAQDNNLFVAALELVCSVHFQIRGVASQALANERELAAVEGNHTNVARGNTTGNE